MTGTPVIDLASRTLYLGAMTTPDAGTTKRHLVFAMSIDDGSMKAGWPVDVAAKAGSGGTAFTAAPQSQRGALAILGDRLYVPYGGLYGDCGNYHGWVVAIALGDPTQVQAWATTARAGGIWAPSGVVSDGQSIYVTTGNTQGATMNMWGGGEGLVRFAPGASFPTPAYWAPTNWLALDNADLDLGGTGPVVVDLAGSTPSRVAVALGKDGNGYLIDRDNLSGVGAPLSMIHAATSQIITAAALYKTASATYVAFRAPGASCTNAAGDLTTLKLMPGTPPRWLLHGAPRKAGPARPSSPPPTASPTPSCGASAPRATVTCTDSTATRAAESSAAPPRPLQDCTASIPRSPPRGASSSPPTAASWRLRPEVVGRMSLSPTQRSNRHVAARPFRKFLRT